MAAVLGCRTFCAFQGCGFRLNFNRGRTRTTAFRSCELNRAKYAPPQRTRNRQTSPTRRLLTPKRPAIHPLASHPPLRKFQRSLLAPTQRPPPAFLQSLRLLPLGRRPRRRNPRQLPRPRTPRLVGRGTKRLPRRPSLASCLRSPPRNHRSQRHSEATVRRSLKSLSPGPDHQALSNMGRYDRLLRKLCESSRTFGAVSLWVP